MRRDFFGARKNGFTLIEVMLVIAIMAIMASLVVMNLQGVEQRKVMQAKDLLILDLQKIRLEANDQGRILGIVALAATDVAAAGYQVVEYVPEVSNTALAINDLQPQVLEQTRSYRWQVAEDFQQKKLPDQSHLSIEMLDSPQQLDRLKQNQKTLPQAIWLGNGEVIPARFQLYQQQNAIGDAIELNRLGLVVEHE